MQSCIICINRYRSVKVFLTAFTNYTTYLSSADLPLQNQVLSSFITFNLGNFTTLTMLTTENEQVSVGQESE